MAIHSDNGNGRRWEELCDKQFNTMLNEQAAHVENAEEDICNARIAELNVVLGFLQHVGDYVLHSHGPLSEVEKLVRKRMNQIYTGSGDKE